MFFWRCKTFFKSLLALVFALTVALAFRAVSVCRLSDVDGKRVFYLDSASSQALMKEELSFLDLFRVKGESVSWTEEGEPTLTVEEIFEKYGAKILFTEETADVVSYYGYTEKWRECVEIDGAGINLHVAVQKNGGARAIGIPILFGGF